METPNYSSVVSATGFLRPRASRDVSTFHEHLLTSRRLLALVGAGLSAPSGLPTFRGAGGLWRTYDARQLSTPKAFQEDPALVWTFFVERRRAAREAKPNAAHLALAEFARKRDLLTVSMNIDGKKSTHVASLTSAGLSERAGHLDQIQYLHGNLLDIKCSKCEFKATDEDADSLLSSIGATVRKEDIPQCPMCSEMLRPAVVWFGESPSKDVLAAIHDWIVEKPIDTVLVIGTTVEVYPATSYVQAARDSGARVAVVNIDQEDVGLLALGEQDWYVQGDVAALLPGMLQSGSGNDES